MDRFELGFARTPRFWLVVIDHAPPPVPGRIPLRSGQSFWLEWRGVEKVWKRRPRFDNDVHALGGFSSVPEEQEPRPPTPPQRRDPPDAPRGRPSQPTGFNPQRFVDTRPLRGRLISQPEPSADSAGSSSTSRPLTTTAADNRAHPAEPTLQQQLPLQQQQAKRRAKSPIAKARPPQPPPSSGSETETSWPSEDPNHAEDNDAMGLTQLNRTTATLADEVIFMQRQQPPRPNETNNPARRPNSENPQLQHALPAHPPQPPVEMENPWFSVSANFEGDFTVSGLLRLLHRVLHEILQQSFSHPNEYLTNLAYHACYYLSKLQSTNDRQTYEMSSGSFPAQTAPGPTAMVLCITNSFVEAEATLDSLVQNHRELPRRHLEKELRRAEGLLRDGRAIFKSWARDPNAPGALPGTAASQNALDGVSFSHLSIEEGGIASLEENLQLALAATQRCSTYMNQLLEWIETHFQDGIDKGSPSPKKRKVEKASGSDNPPCFEKADGDDGEPLQPNKSLQPQMGMRPQCPDLPAPARRHEQRDPGLPHGATGGPEPGAAPFNILKAQQVLEGIMPFTEQQVAASLQEVHSLLSQWTTALWGEPIVLTDSLESTTLERPEAAGAPPQADIEPTMPIDSDGDETVSVCSHRRRRLHAAFDEK